LLAPKLSAPPLAPFLFEACVDSVASARAAAAGGARRLELCESLVEGGVTPSLGKIEAVVAAASPLPVHVLVRPRGGDFCYDGDEVALMLRDVAAAAGGGAAGVAVGALTRDGRVDEGVVGALVARARAAGLAVTLHRAVDASRDPVEAAAAGARAGVDFILSSGGAASAAEGAPVLRAMAAAAGPRVTVIAAGGVGAANVAATLRAAGLVQAHGTARPPGFAPGAATFRKQPPVYMGGERVNSPEAEYGLRVATAESVGAVVRAMAVARAES
jgi:copper homeostasis protein